MITIIIKMKAMLIGILLTGAAMMDHLVTQS